MPLVASLRSSFDPGTENGLAHVYNKQVLPDWSETQAQHDFRVRALEACLSLGKKVETGAVTHITSVVGAA